jgi:hypothetical protein
MALTLLFGWHANDSGFNQVEFWTARRLHHHGGYEKSYLASPTQCRAPGVTFFS